MLLEDVKEKESLIEILVKNPKEFNSTSLNKLIKLLQKTNYGDLRAILLRLFDKNEDLNNSDASDGIMGKLNNRSRKRREKKFWRRVRKGKFSKLILAEGDSWFEYPLFIKDIIDQLNRKKVYAIRSLAYGGDWISNILYEQEYIESLSLIQPDVFLISGGGNDILGDYRLAQLVTQRVNIPSHSINLDTHEGKIEFSTLALNKEFASLMHLLKIQYILLFESIAIKVGNNNNKFKNLKIITQGYDYAIPSDKLGFGFFRALTNKIMGNGKWLRTPLIMRGYNSQKERVAIIHGMMDEFNKMLIEVGEKYENVYHIDSRGSVDSKKGWYNELHPKSREFKKIAKVFEKCIEATDNSKKIYKVNDN